jgi:hypothetical protein
MKYPGKKTPYTKKQIATEKCYRCGRPAKFQWSICANKNYYVPVCELCDYGLNQVALEFMKFPERLKNKLLKAYSNKLYKLK